MTHSFEGLTAQRDPLILAARWLITCSLWNIILSSYVLIASKPLASWEAKVGTLLLTSTHSPAVPEQLDFSSISWWNRNILRHSFFPLSYQDFGLPFYWSFPESVGVFDFPKSLFLEPAHPENGLRPLLWLLIRITLRGVKEETGLKQEPVRFPVAYF